VRLSRYVFVQNFIELSAAVRELSCVQRKNADEHNTVRRYRADGKNMNNTSLGYFLNINNITAYV